MQASIPTDFVIGKEKIFFLGSRTGNEPSTLHAIDLSLASTAGGVTAFLAATARRCCELVPLSNSFVCPYSFVFFHLQSMSTPTTSWCRSGVQC